MGFPSGMESAFLLQRRQVTYTDNMRYKPPLVN
jgi:hypothetical protein